MKNSKELKEMRGDKIAELEAIRDIATAEGRDLSEAENQEVDTLLGGVDKLDDQIKRADKIEANLRTSAMSAGIPLGTKTPKEYKQWSLFKAIKDFQNHNLTGVEAEMHKEATRNNIISGLGIPVGLLGMEKRTNPQTTADANEFIPTEVGEWLQTLQSKMVLGDLATFYSGLRGDVSLPVLSGTAAAWATETANAADAGTAVGGSTLSPKRLAAYMDISKALLHQNPQVEQAIMTDLNRAVASKVENGALLGSGSSGQPTGITAASGVGTVANGAATLAKMVEFETDVAANNADSGRLAFISSVKVRGKLKQVVGQPGVTSSQTGYGAPIWGADNTINGYPAFATTNMDDTYNSSTEGGLYFGSWSDMVIGQFGDSVDITIDNFSQALAGSIRLVINSYWDVAVRRGGSFSKCEGITF
jgi:HK97 family phage major capsid protein